MNSSNRPIGIPTYGFTEGGKIVRLSGKVVAGYDPIVKVTGEGWDDWYPVEDGEYVTLERKPPRGRWEPKLIERCEGIHDGIDNDDQAFSWKY